MRVILSRWSWAVTAACSTQLLAQPATPSAGAASAYIVQSRGTESAVRVVSLVGARVTHDLPIIHGASALLTPAQAARLRQLGTVDLFADSTVMTEDYSGSSYSRSSYSGSGGGYSSPSVPNQDARVEIGADRLGAQGFNGTGVTVAVLDTGLPPAWVQYAQTNSMGLIAYSADGSHFQDLSGHGSHVTTIVANPIRSANGQPLGIAPGVRLVSVKAFNANGTSTYATVLNGLNWIFANRAAYNIRVLNLSFAAKPQSFYWNDPIDQAVMKLWQAGVVVIASAGNWGPAAQTIGVPGNTPYIITVGAMTDSYAPSNSLSWRLTSFSSTGPTFEGFVKPEILAPGGHIIGLMDPTTALLAQLHPTYQLPVDNLYVMSGTSQAAAVVSGSVALMLQANPSLTPDTVKCRLMTSARPAVDANNLLAYSIFQQGAGEINVYDAVYSQGMGCANGGLNIAADLAGTAHFGGPAHQAADGSYYVVDQNGTPINQQGYLWNNTYLASSGYLWNSGCLSSSGYLGNSGYLSSSGYLWNNGYLWNSGYLWNNGYLWNSGYLWDQSTLASPTAAAAINDWVGQQ